MLRSSPLLLWPVFDRAIPFDRRSPLHAAKERIGDLRSVTVRGHRPAHNASLTEPSSLCYGRSLTEPSRLTAGLSCTLHGNAMETFGQRRCEVTDLRTTRGCEVTDLRTTRPAHNACYGRSLTEPFPHDQASRFSISRYCTMRSV
jgi:hypothetical protein